MTTEHWWNDTDEGKKKHTVKTFQYHISLTTNPTLKGLGLNPGLHGYMPTTNRLSHDTAPRFIKTQRFGSWFCSSHEVKNYVIDNTLLRLTSDPSPWTAANVLHMCPFNNTSSLQTFRYILQATTGMDILHTIFRKLEHEGIQLAKSMNMILLFRLRKPNPP
jgi:hypothetical protein